jgi:vancomycin permeability regulator SanA
MKRVRKYIKVFALFFLSWFLIHSVIITADGLNDNVQKADAALILGNTVKENGELSDRLKARVDKGLELYQKGFVKKIIVSGGLGKEGFYEADEMEKYLISKGVNTNDIIADNKASTTYWTAFNYLKIQKNFNFKSVIIVSQYFHISRTRMMLKNLGVNNIYSAHPDYFELRDVYAIPREFFAYYKHLWFGK